MKDSFKSDKYATPVTQSGNRPWSSAHLQAECSHRCKGEKTFFFHFVATNLFNREAQANATCRETLLQVGLNFFAYLVH